MLVSLVSLVFSHTPWKEFKKKIGVKLKYLCYGVSEKAEKP
jgi:hypothetical protein